MVRVEILKGTVGDGKDLESGEIYQVKANTAMVLIHAGKARLAETSMVKVQMLKDDISSGMRCGDVLEMTASGAERLIKEYKAEILFNESDNQDTPKIKVLITQNTQAEVDGKKATFLEAGKTYNLKTSEAALLIGLGKAKFPDTAVKAEIKFNRAAVIKGNTYMEGDIVNLPAVDAEDIIRRNMALPIRIEEDQECSRPTTEKKTFFEKALGM